MVSSTAKKSRHSNTGTRPLTFDYVKGVARGRWREIAIQVFGIDAQYLDGNHGPCPICNDGTKRWRVFKDFADVGGAICNDCNKTMGDGFKLGAAKLGLPLKEVLLLVAKHLGAEDGPAGGSNSTRGKSEDPAKHLVFDPSNSLLPYFCLRKPPVTMAAIARCHGQEARYRNQHTVLALPVWGEKLTTAPAIGWTMYAVPAGTLPTWPKKGGPTVQVKIKTTYGSQPGWIGPVNELAAATHVWKLEGPSDLLAWYSLANIPAGHIALTNCNGAGEPPKPWMLKMLAGKVVYVLHDADKAGEEGAIGAEGTNGRRKVGWLELLAREGIEAFQVKLPYEVEEKHGKDLRDFVNGRVG